jgi:hypothetical protein
MLPCKLHLTETNATVWIVISGSSKLDVLCVFGAPKPYFRGSVKTIGNVLEIVCKGRSIK